VSGSVVFALVLVSLIIGGHAGNMFAEHTAHIRSMNAITGRYLAEKAYLDTLTADLLNELKQSTTQVKSSLKKKSKEVKRHGK